MLRLLKLTVLVLWILLCFIAAWLSKCFKKTAWRDAIACGCYRGALWIAGIRVTAHGGVSTARPLLVVSNHVSYLDIALLGSVYPFSFTPKQEIASWPGIAALCRVTDAVFIERKTEKFKESVDKIRAALSKKRVVSLFPEATTGNGMQVLPFKSGLFHLADTPIDGETLAVQPVAIVYTRIRRLPIDSCQWPLLAWYGDMKLLPHLWNMLALGHIDVTLEFMPPVTMKEFGDRKGLAARCHQVISEAVHRAR